MTSARTTTRLRGAMMALAGVLVIGGLSGCALRPMQAPLVPPFGVIYTQISAPLDIDVAPDGQPTPIDGLRLGTSQTKYINIPWFNFSFAWQDGSYATAVANGNLQTIHYADYEWMNILTVYQQVTFNVYGE